MSSTPISISTSLSSGIMMNATSPTPATSPTMPPAPSEESSSNYNNFSNFIIIIIMLTDNTGTVVGVSIGVVVVIAVFIIDLIVVFVGIWFIAKKSIRKNATPKASDKLNAEVCQICLFLSL